MTMWTQTQTLDQNAQSGAHQALAITIVQHHKQRGQHKASGSMVLKEQCWKTQRANRRQTGYIYMTAQARPANDSSMVVFGVQPPRLDEPCLLAVGAEGKCRQAEAAVQDSRTAKLWHGS